MLDFNEMVIFVKVVEAEGFTAAATNLGLPKSTVSRKISELESRLGARLLQRTTRSVRPTELGALYYERCARLVTEAEEAERAISQCQEQPRGLLRITLPVDIGISIMPAVTREFMQQHPEIRLQVDVSDRYVDLVGEGFDLAIRAGVLEDSTLVAHRLYTDRMLVCATPGYLKQRGIPRSPEDLKQHDCVVFSALRSSETLKFTRQRGEVVVEISGRMGINNLNAIRGVCLTGAGIGLLPELHCQDLIATGELVSVLDDWSVREGGIYAVYPSPRHLTPKVRAFITFLDRHFSNLPH
ncbi:LysR family transcriptional regulator [Sedimenticola sp.]|uniref:LysR family transcriptional regulator n=1 Tax=Sedimenticola sp. TaxID=1940285 RepID=UPI00258B8EC5|nr:LysR family transcriptional regulator [Sedimenticola sp.]MCW8903109.1 LysR family transcriptional regulator [Sedimenticola sp.]